MGILSRCADILSANVNDLLDRVEDKNRPKMIDQMLRKSREDLAAVKKETAAVMANETAAKRKLDECTEKIAQYNSAAMNAVRAGNDGDARKLLESKQRLESTLAGLQTNYDAAHKDATNMQAIYDKLVGDIELLESRASMIKATDATAKARERVNKMTAGAAVGSSLEAFDRMESKAMSRLDAANAEATLNQRATAGEDLLKQYSGASSSSVDDELAKLKAQMAGGSDGTV